MHKQVTFYCEDVAEDEARTPPELLPPPTEVLTERLRAPRRSLLTSPFSLLPYRIINGGCWWWRGRGREQLKIVFISCKNLTSVFLREISLSNPFEPLK